MANTFINGRLGTITVGGTQFAARQFSFTITIPLDDITYCKAGGVTWQKLLPGYAKAEGTITFVYDILNQPNLSPQQLISMPAALLSLSLSPDGTKFYIFSAYSGSFSFSSGPAAGPVSCTTNFSSDDAVTFPV